MSSNTACSFIGKKYHRLTVLREDLINNRTYWVCRCECGNETRPILAKLVKRGNNKSCGCLKRKSQSRRSLSLTPPSTVFGRLTVLENKAGICRCVCSCGRQKTVRAGILRAGSVRSCGCLRKETTAALNRVEMKPGDRHGQLTVLEWNPQTPYRVKCRCICGKEKWFNPKTLRRSQNPTVSCGCFHREIAGRSQIVALTEGAQFGLLTVTEQMRGKGRGTLVRCVCRCGRSALISSKKLISGHTKSCGCLRHDVWKTRTGYSHERPFRERYTQYRSAAKARNREFSLSREDVRSFLAEPCSYCKSTTHQIGLDRLNNEAGYTKENVVSCCVICNRAKYQHSVNDFIAHVRSITTHQPSGVLHFNGDPEQARGCWLNYQNTARKRHRRFSLDLETFYRLTQSVCAYCGEPPRTLFAKKYRHNGLDRIDNARGYTLENSVPACSFCNRAKGQLNVTTFLEWANRVVKA